MITIPGHLLIVINKFYEESIFFFSITYCLSYSSKKNYRSRLYIRLPVNFKEVLFYSNNYFALTKFIIE